MQKPELIGIVYNPRAPQAAALGTSIGEWLQNQGVQTWLLACDDYITSNVAAQWIITLGGDGTILRAVRRTAVTGVPILGFNMGRVGFLTEAPPSAWGSVLEHLLAGEGHITEHAMLRATLCREEQVIACDDALNDAVISRGALARTVRLQTRVDGVPLTRYVTDGLILATATGSTAYAYAVGGPIIPPWLDTMLMIPTAAHLSLDRPLVLNAEAIVEVEVHTDIPGIITVDGHLEGELFNNDVVQVVRSPLKARFLRLQNRTDFYRTLVARLTPRNGE